MAQQFIVAILHPSGWKNADIISSIPQNVIHNVVLGSVQGSAGVGILGAGSPPLQGVALNACFISAPTTTATMVSPSSIDPPVIYTFCNATQPYGRDFLNLNLKMIRANDYAFNIQVVLNGSAVNLTNGTLRMSCKWKATDPDANEIFSVSSPSNGIAFINATQGTATVTIASVLTNITAIPFHRIDPVYDIQYTDPSGKRYTIMYGTLTILPNISQTSP